MTARRWFHIATLLLASAFAVPTPAASQDAPRNLAELLPDLILREITLPRPVTAGLSHVAHFSPIDADELDNPAVAVVRSFNTLMLMQLSTFPLGSPAGGFTYTFDETLGTFRRTTPSFGPVFAERAVTMGRNRFNAGFSYQHTAYRSFEGQDIERRRDQVLPAPRGMLFGRAAAAARAAAVAAVVVAADLSSRRTTRGSTRRSKAISSRRRSPCGRARIRPSSR